MSAAEAGFATRFVWCGDRSCEVDDCDDEEHGGPWLVGHHGDLGGVESEHETRAEADRSSGRRESVALADLLCDDGEDPCADCGAPAETVCCADCGVWARVIDCGCRAQPRPIAASAHGGSPVCEECEAARDDAEVRS